jgi:hypothetical protein
MLKLKRRYTMKRKQKCLTQEQIQELLNSKYVEKVFNNRIIYTNEFKNMALIQYRNGLPPVEIFINAGLNLELIGRKNAVNLILKWNNEGIKTDAQLSLEKQLEYLQAENAYLKAENEYLKKLS